MNRWTMTLLAAAGFLLIVRGGPDVRAATNKSVMVNASRVAVYPATGQDLVLTGLVVKVGSATNAASPVTLAQLQAATNTNYGAITTATNAVYAQATNAAATAAAALYLPLSGGDMVGHLGLGGYNITNCAYIVDDVGKIAVDVFSRVGYATDGVTETINWANLTLSGQWTVNSNANDTTEIVNFQTMTNRLASYATTSAVAAGYLPKTGGTAGTLTVTNLTAGPFSFSTPYIQTAAGGTTWMFGGNANPTNAYLLLENTVQAVLAAPYNSGLAGIGEAGITYLTYYAVGNYFICTVPFEFSGTAEFSSDVTLTDTVWKNVSIPALSMHAPGANAPTFTQAKTDGAGSTGVWCYVFSDAATNNLFFSAEIPSDYSNGTAIAVEVHWMPIDASAGNVTWGIEYSIQNVDGVFGNTTKDTASDAAAGVAWTHQQHQIETISGTGLTGESCIMGRVYRVGSDTLAAGAALLHVNLRYQADSLGDDNQ